MAWCSIFERQFNELISQMIRLRDDTTRSLWQQQAGFDDPWQPTPPVWHELDSKSLLHPSGISTGLPQHRLRAAHEHCYENKKIMLYSHEIIYKPPSQPACRNNWFESIFIKELINPQSSGFWCALIKAQLKTKCVLTAELSKAPTLCFDSCAAWVFLQCRNSFGSQCQRNRQCRSHIPGSPELSALTPTYHQGFPAMQNTMNLMLQ